MSKTKISPRTAEHGSIRLTVAQAVIRYLAGLRVQADSEEGTVPLFGGIFAIFGHGNVAGLGEALFQYRDSLPTYRAHNEQAMAHTAIAYAKAHFRRRMMVCTTSIGPGATNLVTAAALAHVNRLPVLLLPGDIFVSGEPAPVLQQVEDFQNGALSANDCLRPVSRYFERIVHPAQLLTVLPRAIAVLTDPALCGPVTLAMPQDVQTVAFDYPVDFFETCTVPFRAMPPAVSDVVAAVRAIMVSKRPVIISGGGVLYSGAWNALRTFAEKYGIPICETQAGKSALPWDHPLQLGAVGVTGSPAANSMASEADLILSVGSRLQDFTTGSHTLFPQAQLVSLNVNSLDSIKAGSIPLQADARLGIEALENALQGWQAETAWTKRAEKEATAWRATVDRITQRHIFPEGELPYDGEVIGMVQRSCGDSTKRDIVVGAAGTLPGELHKLWRTEFPGGYHMEYGYSCMGYEIAGGLGVKMARPEKEVIVTVGDGSYLMLSSEIATSVMLGKKLIIVVLDNRGFGCINRLQQHCGGEPFNNLLADCFHVPQGMVPINFATNAASLGALSEHVQNIEDFEKAMQRARAATRTYVIVIDTDPARTTNEGGWWWEVAVPEESPSAAVREARVAYEQNKRKQKR